MRLYAGTSKQFVTDTSFNQITDKLSSAFFEHFRYKPSQSEVNSWRNSLRAISDVINISELHNQGIILEYQLPLSSKRLDFLICGKNGDGQDEAVIIELKQWDKCQESASANEVLTYVGGGIREVLHPSVQVQQYQHYLQDCHTAFYEKDGVSLSACAYLHNYNYYKEDVLFASKFTDVLEQTPVFTGDDVSRLSKYLKGKVEGGDGERILARIEESKYRPSKKLMEHVGNVIRGKSEYVLLDEQLVAYDKVVECAHTAFHDKQKSAIIIKGGPGTGKSVIAINLMADLLEKDYNAQYATGSRAFTETLRAAIGKRGAPQFKYFNSYMDADRDVVDVLICDEAHRIRKSSNNRFTPKEKQSNLPQIEEILRASRVSVFFIDDNQVVRPDEIGSVAYIKQFAEQNNFKVHEFELEAQFRCNGSDGFLNWINNTLGIKKTANVIWNTNEDFDFRIFSSPLEVEKAIREKAEQGVSARMMAGFCWPWSDPDSVGNLTDDVVIGDYKRPWNAKPEAKRLAPGIPKAPLWAYEAGGIDQVGCIYTAQGFEFEYAGVIFGKDLVYRFGEGDNWQGNKQESQDGSVKRSKDTFTELVKNTYRVLLSRGIKGCYVYFMDKETENFFRSRIE